VVRCSRHRRNRNWTLYLPHALKVVGALALITATLRDPAHASVYVPGIVALATSQFVLGGRKPKPSAKDTENY
jgi:hypothetical protein